MSVYQRFYIRTSHPQDVEQLLLEVLGGSGQFYTDDRGRFLRPIKVTVVDSRTILPTRSYYGWPIDSEVETGWYWLETIMDLGSLEAAWTAWSLLMSTHVDMVAEDNEISGEEEQAKAGIIDWDNPPFGQSVPPCGPLQGESPMAVQTHRSTDVQPAGIFRFYHWLGFLLKALRP